MCLFSLNQTVIDLQHCCDQPKWVFLTYFCIFDILGYTFFFSLGKTHSFWGGRGIQKSHIYISSRTSHNALQQFWHKKRRIKAITVSKNTQHLFLCLVVLLKEMREIWNLYHIPIIHSWAAPASLEAPNQRTAYSYLQLILILSIQKVQRGWWGKHMSSPYEKPLRNLPRLHMSFPDNPILMNTFLKGSSELSDGFY